MPGRFTLSSVITTVLNESVVGVLRSETVMTLTSRSHGRRRWAGSTRSSRVPPARARCPAGDSHSLPGSRRAHRGSDSAVTERELKPGLDASPTADP